MTKDTNDKRDEIINTCTYDIDVALRKCREALAKECDMTVEKGMVMAWQNAVGFLKALRRAFSDKVDLTTGKRS